MNAVYKLGTLGAFAETLYDAWRSMFSNLKDIIDAKNERPILTSRFIDKAL